MSTQAYTSAVSTTWTVPAHVYFVTVEVWGAGGGGGWSGGGTAYKKGMGGGGGGYSRKVLAVTPGTEYAIAVGAGGAGGKSTTIDGGAGGDSIFGASVVLAKGGTGGSGNSTLTGGTGAAAASGVGDVKYSGGDGAGTGGGGSGGSAADGNDAVGRTGGTAVTGGGPGADGRQYYSGQTPASGPGGGGSGGEGNASGTAYAGGAGYAGKILLTYFESPDAPTITAPVNGAGAAPGTVSLTASATHPSALQVKYRWTYSYEGGADTTIGDTALVDSGEEATYSWDASALAVGTYLLKCWTVSEEGILSGTYDDATLYLAHVVVTAPADESSHISGEITLTGKGYLSDAGQLRLQWEVDSHNPPDPESADYDLITSALVDQGEEVSVTANATHLGTWYFRARTLDTEAAPSAWTALRTIYVLERLRLLPGSQVKRSLGKWANRVYCVVEQSSPLIVAVATNTTVSPTYAESPREIVIVAPPGSDLAGAQAIANAHLVLRMDPSTQLKLSGLQVRLLDGMKLARGQRVGIVIERDDIDATLPIIELTYDASAAVCEVTVGNWWEPKTMSDYLLAIAQKVQQLEKEAATARHENSGA